MISLFRKLWRDKRGNAIMIAGAALPMIVGAAGLASDTIQWTLWKRQLQRAADSAAIAGVYNREAAVNGATTTTVSAVTHDLTLNRHTWMGLKTGYPQVTYPADSGQMIHQVRVSIAVRQRLPFSSLFMTVAPTIIANATAASVPAAGDPCVLAEETSAVSGILISGNADISMPNCVMHSNASASNAAYAKGSSKVVAQAVSAVGGIQSSNNWTVGSYRPYSPKVADPFANVNPTPGEMNCGQKIVVKGGKNTVEMVALDETTDLAHTFASDGTTKANCFTSLSVGSGKTLNLPTGTYFINGGDATIQGTLSCSGCTIIMTNSDPSTTATIGQFKANAGANVNMTAPSGATDKYKGIAIYQDRRAVDQSGKPNLINGNSGSIIEGALYFPSQELDYNGTGTTNAICTMFVARRVNFTGNNGTTNNFKGMSQCGYVGLGGGNSIRMVRLVA